MEDLNKRFLYIFQVLPLSVVVKPVSFMEEQERFETRFLLFVKLWSLSARHWQVKLVIARFLG